MPECNCWIKAAIACDAHAFADEIKRLFGCRRVGFDEEKGMVLIADRPGDPVRIHWLDDADLVRIIKFVTIGAVN